MLTASDDLPAAQQEISELGAEPCCPACGREGTLVVIGDAFFCAACGYTSEGISGCT